MAKLIWVAAFPLALVFSGCGGGGSDALAKEESAALTRLAGLVESIQTADDAKAKAGEVASATTALVKVRAEMAIKGVKSASAAAGAEVKKEIDRLKNDPKVKEALGSALAALEGLF